VRARAFAWLMLTGVPDAATAIAQEINSSPSIYFVTLNNWLDGAEGYRVLDRNTATKIVLTRRF